MNAAGKLREASPALYRIPEEDIMLIDSLIKAAEPKVKHRIWVISDLQQSLPERATHCMTRAMADFLTLNKEVELVNYLGDSVEGADLGFIRQMTEMQMEELSKITAPVYYIPGNHDFDYYCFKTYREREKIPMTIPFIEMVKGNPQWHVPADMTKMSFTVDLGDIALVYFPDHADPEGKWFTTHGEVRGDKGFYPYWGDAYKAVMEDIAALGKPVLTFSHYSYPGGNREAPLFRSFFPLAPNIRMHFYGHAHIGDAKWAGKDCHRKICGVDDHPVMQINCASLENYRGSAIRSVIVEWYEDDEIGILFRNHTLHVWDDYMVVRKGDGIRSPEID